MSSKAQHSLCVALGVRAAALVVMVTSWDLRDDWALLLSTGAGYKGALTLLKFKAVHI